MGDKIVEAMILDLFKKLEKDNSNNVLPDKLYSLLFGVLTNNTLLLNILELYPNIIKYCNEHLSIYSYFIIVKLRTILKQSPNSLKYKEIINICNNYIKKIDQCMCKDASNFIKILYKNIESKGTYIDSGELFKKVIKRLKEKDTETSSKILVDLFKYSDFANYLDSTKPLVYTLIQLYYNYSYESYNVLNGNNLCFGSNILGKLLDETNETALIPFFKNLLGKKDISTKNIKMIGCGGSCMVFKIGDKVLKVGETRINKKIIVNHRILKSELRRLIEINGLPRYYVEIMQYIDTNNITLDDVEELNRDLLSMGILWDDAKVINCGVLPENYDNYTEASEIDYTQVCANIDIPTKRDQFQKVKRRVVVLDNDDMRLNPYITSG